MREYQPGKWYQLTAQQVTHSLGTNTIGLNQQEVERRENHFGLNVLTQLAPKALGK